MTDHDELTVVMPSKEHRTIHGTNLALIRSSLRDESGKPVSQAVFAAICGYSQPFQAQIESPGEHEVLVEIAERIRYAIRYFQNYQ